MDDSREMSRMDQGHRTEAACLLEQGAKYKRRVGLTPLFGPAEPIFAGFKPGAFSVYFGDAPIYHFDLEGRWQRAYVDGTHFLKGLDGTIHTIDRVREGGSLVLKRQTLGYAQASAFDARVRSMSLDLIESIDLGQLGLVEPPASKSRPLPSDELHAFLERIARWDAAAWCAHRERYMATYGPLPFLPPECQNAVVLQATLAKAGGFGIGGSPPSEPVVRSLREFEQHVNEVAALWGRRLLQSRSIFLAGRDLMHLPADDVNAYLNTASVVFPIEPESSRQAAERAAEGDDAGPRLDGVHVFLDDFAALELDRAAWGEFAARRVIRVSLGVESGDPDVRAIFGKNWTDLDLRAVVANLKAAGLAASVLTLVGAGGVERAAPHLSHTSRLIESLDLGPGDFVFLLDENEFGGSQSIFRSETPYEKPAWAEQQAKLKEALAPLKKRGIKVLPYTLEKQWA